MSSTEPPYWSLLQHAGHEPNQKERTEAAREEASAPVIDQRVAEKATEAVQTANNA